MAFLENMIEKYDLLKHKVLLFLLEPGQIDRNIAGLIANKFMAKYQRPCCILTKVTEGVEHIDNLEDSSVLCQVTIKESYQGSARGYDKSGITNFKDICSNCSGVIFAEGHQGAFGLGIAAEKVNDFLAETDEVLKYMESEPVYHVDYIYEGENVNPQNIIDIANLEDLWGKDMDEAFVAISNLKVTKDMVTLMSPDKKPTLKITLPNKVALIKFGSNQEEYEKLLSDGYVQVDIVGRCNKNVWNGYTSAQIFIEDYEITGMAKYIF